MRNIDRGKVLNKERDREGVWKREGSITKDWEHIIREINS